MADEEKVEQQTADTDHWRLFVAIAFPSALKDECGKLIQRLKTGTQFCGAYPTWVKTASLHLTLAFLGSTPVSKVPEIESIMRVAGADMNALRLRLGGVSLFPSAKNPRVIALHLSGDVAKLQQIQGALNHRLATAGFPIDHRPFRPHITLARIKSMRGLAGLRDLVQTHRDSMVGECLVHGLTLYRSHLLPDGAEYETVVETPFGRP